MTKEEKIKEAYGEHFEKCNPDKNGWFLSNNCVFNFCKNWDKLGFGNTLRFRPKSLQGIENNNGWIKIKSEADLPKEYEFYNACHFNKKNKNDIPMFYGCNLPDLRNYFDEELITHYQPIQKPEPPIY